MWGMSESPQKAADAELWDLNAIKELSDSTRQAVYVPALCIQLHM